MTHAVEPFPSVDDHERALTEVSFLLDIFAATIDEMMGGATAPVGRIAGRQMARKIPVYFPSPTLPEVLTAVASRLQKGFAVEAEERPHGAFLRFGDCAVRTVCRARGLELGGPLCRIFHHYVDGMVNELLQRPTRSELTRLGDDCLCTLEVK